MRKLNNEEFIIKAMSVHGDEFDYSKFVYIGTHTKGIIVCKTHGEFLQSPGDHLSGRGCSKCGGTRKLTKEEFISKTMLIHTNDKYIYDRFVYINSHIVGIIICKLHGEFKQTPNDHLNGSGCPECKRQTLRNYFVDSLDMFIAKANNIHNYKFYYNKFIYYNQITPGIIICKKHGEFKQTPGNHLSGQGCPICCLSKGELKIIKYLDNNNIKYIQQYKFADCKNPKTGCKLKFDFYIPSKNLLIEYDGEQHFFIKRFGNYIQTKEDLENLQFRDNIKNEYATTNNIKLLRISYTSIKNVEDILVTEL